MKRGEIATIISKETGYAWDTIYDIYGREYLKYIKAKPTSKGDER